MALGPWAPDLLEPLGIKLPLAVKRGYHRHFRPRGNAGLTRPVVDVDNGYCLAPMEQGIRLTTGAEFADRDAPPTPGAVRPADAGGRRACFRSASAVEAQPWMGSRPCFADSMPVIGRAPGQTGLWLAYGHAHWGLTLGPATGRLVAEMITGAHAVLRSRAVRGRAVLVAYRAELVAPGRQRAGKRQGARLVDAARHRARQHMRGDRAELGQFAAPDRASGRRPVAAANTVSPSSVVWTGWIARASPSCAITANCLACALVSVASVATIAMVVFSPGPPLATRDQRRRAAPSPESPWPPNSPFCSNGAAQKCRLGADGDAAAGVDRDQRADGVARRASPPRPSRARP